MCKAGTLREVLFESGKKKAHKDKHFGPDALGTNLGLSQKQTQVVPETTQFVRGTSPVCPWDKLGAKGGRRSSCGTTHNLQVYMPFSRAIGSLWIGGGSPCLLWGARSWPEVMENTAIPPIQHVKPSHGKVHFSGHCLQRGFHFLLGIPARDP